MKTSFSYHENEFFCEKVNVNDFYKKTPTPFYLYSENEIIQNCNQVQKAGAGFDFMPCYALKANYNPSLLSIIRDQGFGADVVSGGELLFALKAGFPADKIVFAGVGKNRPEIELALRNDIHSLNIESREELMLTSKVAAHLKKTATIAFRINPDIDAKTHSYISTGMHSNKFGISPTEALELYKMAADDAYLEPEGIHVHIGSQITQAGPYLETVRFLIGFIEKLRSQSIDIKYLDLGGGIGIKYDNIIKDDAAETTYIPRILPQYLEGLKKLKVKLIVELGRSLVGSAGVLITKTLYRKRTPVKKFLIVDAAMNNLLRPSLYDAHHEIVPLKQNERHTELVDVVGPVCETGDFLARERLLPHVDSGEGLAILGAGAYGQVLSSNYNLRPKIAEFMVNDSTIKTIYPGQTIEDMFNEYKW